MIMSFAVLFQVWTPPHSSGLRFALTHWIRLGWLCFILILLSATKSRCLVCELLGLISGPGSGLDAITVIGTDLGTTSSWIYFLILRMVRKRSGLPDRRRHVFLLRSIYACYSRRIDRIQFNVISDYEILIFFNLKTTELMLGLSFSSLSQHSPNSFQSDSSRLSGRLGRIFCSTLLGTRKSFTPG